MGITTATSYELEDFRLFQDGVEVHTERNRIIHGRLQVKLSEPEGFFCFGNADYVARYRCSESCVTTHSVNCRLLAVNHARGMLALDIIDDDDEGGGVTLGGLGPVGPHTLKDFDL